METNIVRLIDAYYLAKKVVHYYWMHTEGDTLEGAVSVENIQKIVELMTGIKIEKFLVPSEGKFIRGFTDRNHSTAQIYIADNQSDEWKRQTTVKELCHILCDNEDEFQPNPKETIEHIIADEGKFDEHSTPVAMSERIAEIVAIELLYPLELRDSDLVHLGEGASISALALTRKVPPRYIEIACNEQHIKLSREIWKRLPQVDPPNLNEALDNQA